MIRYLQGNLLDSDHRVIVHGCNNHGVMGSGIAVQIKQRWPNVYEVYRLKHQVFGLSLGDIIPVATADGRVVVNAITQDGFGGGGHQYVDYAAMERCFSTINDRVSNWEVDEIAYPLIGAGLGGGDWSIISELIERTATAYRPIVYTLDGLIPSKISM